MAASSLLCLALCVSALTLVHAGNCFSDVEKPDVLPNMQPPEPAVSVSNRQARVSARPQPDRFSLYAVLPAYKECSSSDYHELHDRKPCYLTNPGPEGTRVLHFSNPNRPGEPQPVTCYCNLCGSVCKIPPPSDAAYHCQDPLTLSQVSVNEFCKAAASSREASPSSPLCVTKEPAGCVFSKPGLFELLATRARKASLPRLAQEIRERVHRTAIYRQQDELLNAFARLREGDLYNLLASAFAPDGLETSLLNGLESKMGGRDAVYVLKALVHLLYRRLRLRSSEVAIETLTQLKQGVPDMQNEESKRKQECYFMSGDVDIYSPAQRYHDLVFELFLSTNPDAFRGFSIELYNQLDLQSAPATWKSRVGKYLSSSSSSSSSCQAPLGAMLCPKDKGAGGPGPGNDPLDILLFARGFRKEAVGVKKEDRVRVALDDLVGVRTPILRDGALRTALNEAQARLDSTRGDYKGYGEMVQLTLEMALEAHGDTLSFSTAFAEKAREVLLKLREVVFQQLEEWCAPDPQREDYLLAARTELFTMLSGMNVFYEPRPVFIDPNIPPQIEQLLRELDALLKACKARTPLSLGKLAQEIPLIVPRLRWMQAKQQLETVARGLLLADARPVLDLLLQGSAMKAYVLQLIVCLRHALAFKAVASQVDAIINQVSAELTQVRGGMIKSDLDLLFPNRLQQVSRNDLHYHYLLTSEEYQQLTRLVRDEVDLLLTPRGNIDLGPSSLTLQRACEAMNERGKWDTLTGHR